jgi:hypothetical protein
VEDDSNQSLGAAAVNIECTDQDFISVVREGRYPSAVGNALQAEIELFVSCEASSAVGLGGVMDTQPPLVHFGNVGRELRTGGRRQAAGGRRQEAGGRRRAAGCRRQKAGGRRQKAEGRKQKAESRRQKAGGRRQKAAC